MKVNKGLYLLIWYVFLRLDCMYINNIDIIIEIVIWYKV